MATKKQAVLEAEMADKDYMDILAMNDSDVQVFQRNNLIDYSYPTGISVIDYSLGYEVNIKDETGKLLKKRLCLGLQAGSFNVITGATQSFKTTLGMQMCANIAYANDGNVIHLDAENRLVVQRLKNLTQLPDAWFDGEHPRYALRAGAIGYDTLQSYVTAVYESKMKFKNLLLKDTGVVDSHNQPIWLMPPTVIFLDSLSDVIAKEYDIRDSKEWDKQKEMRGNTDGMQNAKTLKGVISDILPMLKEANIVFITIAHENANVSMNAFATPKKQFQYGDHAIKISGGKSVEYNASSVMGLTGEIKDDSRYTEATDGFVGNTVLYEPIKLSTNQSGNKKTGFGFRIVVDKVKNGCDNLRTLVLFLNDKGRLKGNKAGFKVIDEKGNELSEKFTWKKIYEDFQSNPVTYKIFLQASKEELEKLVSPALDVAGKIKPFSLMDELTSLS
jgi:hypothetical protein